MHLAVAVAVAVTVVMAAAAAMVTAMTRAAATAARMVEAATMRLLGPAMVAMVAEVRWEAGTVVTGARTAAMVRTAATVMI